MTKMHSLLNLFSLNTTVSRKVISFSDISAVDLIVGWDLLTCSIKRSTSFLSLSLRPFGLFGLLCCQQMESRVTDCDTDAN